MPVARRVEQGSFTMPHNKPVQDVTDQELTPTGQGQKGQQIKGEAQKGREVKTSPGQGTAEGGGEDDLPRASRDQVVTAFEDEVFLQNGAANVRDRSHPLDSNLREQQLRRGSGTPQPRLSQPPSQR